MALFYPKFYLTLGEPGVDSIYVQDSTGTWHDFSHYEYFMVKKGDNQISTFEFKIFDIQDTEKDYIKEQAKVVFLSGNTLILKGVINIVEYATGYECTAKGYGPEIALLNKELIKSGQSDPKRIQYNNESTKTIANEILSENTDGESPWLITPATTGLFATDYGDLTIRYEYASRLKSMNALCNAINYHWWVSQDTYDYDVDSFNVKSTRGSSTSVKSFTITGAYCNCSATSIEKDTSNMVNHISLLGYGDGTSQLKTSTYNASTIYTTLLSDITTTSVTISLVDASDFASSGTIRIQEEQITYTGKTGNNLTGCTRASGSTTAKAHKKGVYTEQYYVYTSPQDDSSISTYGLMDYTIVDPTLINESTAELVSTKYLLERMIPLQRITLIPDEPQIVVTEVDIGDAITITDAETGLSGEYSIATIEYKSEYGYLSMEIGVSNRTLQFMEQMQKQREELEDLAKYMQGAINIYSNRTVEDCDSSSPMYMKFFIPTLAAQITSATLRFKTKSPRGYHTHTGTTASLVLPEFPSGSPTVVIKIGEDGETLTALDDSPFSVYEDSSTSVDITTEVAAVGTAKWVSIEFTPSAFMRIEADIHLGVFVEAV